MANIKNKEEIKVITTDTLRNAPKKALSAALARH